MGKLEQSRSYLAEGIVENIIEKRGFNYKRLTIAKKGNEFDEEGIKQFLKGYSKYENLYPLLEKLGNSAEYNLPDFISFNPKTNEVYFTEVKSENRKLSFGKLSNKKQKKCFKILAKEGYTINIVNIRFEGKIVADEDFFDSVNEEQGRMLKGENVPRDKEVKLKPKNIEIDLSTIPNILLIELLF